MKVWLFEKTQRNYVIVLGVAIIALSLFTLSSSDTYSHMVSAAQQILFQDDYSSSAGWTQIGTQITVNSIAHPGVAYFDNVMGGGGVTQNRVYKQISSPLPSGSWTADFDYKFTATGPSGADDFIFGLSPTSGDLNFLAAGNPIFTVQFLDSLYLSKTGGLDTIGIPILPDIQYYVRMDKTPTQVQLSVFLDPARSILVGSSVLPLAVTDLGSLNFIQHEGCTVCGPARALTAQIDNTKIYTTSTVPRSGLVGEWNFENNVLDTSGTGNDGTLSGGTSFVPGIVGQALNFDGSSGVVI